MSSISETFNEREQTKEICVHFDTEKHQITLDEFVQTVCTYETIAMNFANELLRLKVALKYIYCQPKQVLLN